MKSSSVDHEHYSKCFRLQGPESVDTDGGVGLNFLISCTERTRQVLLLINAIK